MSDQNKLNRREFIKGAATAGAGIAAVGALAACSPTPAPATAVPATAVPATAVSPTKAPAAATAVPPTAVPATAVPTKAPAPSASGVPAKWDFEADVIVVGTGPAGVACAAAAAENKASVMVIEANDKIGGKGILAGGNLGIGGGTRMQLEAKFVETADIIYQDRTEATLRTDKTMTVEDVEGGKHTIGQWRKIAGAEDAEGMSRVFADRSLDTWNWLDKMGCPFIKANVSEFANVYRGSRYYTTTKASPVNREGKPTDMQAGGAGLIWPMYDVAKKNGAQFFLKHKMTKIIREGVQSGRVLGIQVDAEGKTLYFKAKKAVFLGTGSWKGSKLLKVLFLPWLIKYPTVSGQPYVNNDGSGIELAIEAGASLTTDRGSDWHGWHRHTGTRWHSINMPYGLPGTAEPLEGECIYVNSLGKRFMNEEIGEDNPAWVGGSKPFYFAQICAQQPTDDYGPIVWVILDETARAKQKLDFTVDKTVEANMYANAATVAELAAKIKVPADALTAAVTKYNSLVAAGKDTDFGKKGLDAQIAKPPFHAVKWGIQKHNTLGGVTINPKSQVMDWKGKVIPGLYAAGESAGGMDLIGLSKPILFGRVAGEWAAKETGA